VELIEIGSTGQIANYAGYGITDLAVTAVPADNQPG
jgi:hypothetical protein